MKIRIDEPGYESFTGDFGVVPFEDGVSVDDVSRVEINLLSTMVKIVDAETGNPLGALYDYDHTVDTPASVIHYKTQAEIDAEQADGGAPAAPAEPAEPAEPQKTSFTKEDLEKIADEKGIAGLRTVADQFNVKGTSIAGLIEAILDAQGGSATKTQE